jgi:hypothetical protein
MVKKISYSIAILLFVVISRRIVYKGYFGAPLIKIENKSSVELEDVVLSGSGWSHSISKIPGNQIISFVAHPKGESSVSISFVASGRQVRKEAMDYFESSGGYCVFIIIDAKLNVSCESSIGCFSLKRTV